MKKQKGFTLIELMVVMAIIAILATAGLSAYTGYIKGARDSKRVTMARELQTIVESLSTISGAPTPTELTTYLNAEGIAWNIPTETPLLVRAAESVVGVLGIPDALALLEDPIGGKAVCLNHLKEAKMVCQFVYYQFSDGTYAISYGVEKESSLVNPHYSRTLVAGGGQRAYGSFVGNSIAVTANTATEKNIEDDGEPLAAANITIAESVGVSEIGSNTNGGTDGGGCDTTCPSGETCTSGTCMCGTLPACAVDETCVNDACTPPAPTCGSGTILINNKCWMPTDLGGSGTFYQFMKVTPVTQNDWTNGDAASWTGSGAGDGDPCRAADPNTRLPNDQELGALSLDQITNTLGLTMNGYLGADDGSLNGSGTDGFYWSSSGSPLRFTSYYAVMYFGFPAHGFSVRCLQD